MGMSKADLATFLLAFFVTLSAFYIFYQYDATTGLRQMKGQFQMDTRPSALQNTHIFSRITELPGNELQPNMSDLNDPVKQENESPLSMSDLTGSVKQENESPLSMGDLTGSDKQENETPLSMSDLTGSVKQGNEAPLSISDLTGSDKQENESPLSVSDLTGSVKQENESPFSMSDLTGSVRQENGSLIVSHLTESVKQKNESPLSMSDPTESIKTSVTNIHENGLVMKPPKHDWSLYNIQRRVTDSEDNNTRIHEERIHRIRTVCKDIDLFDNRAFRGRSTQIAYSSHKYNFSYCKVPKAGCTFWTQLFLILHDYPAKIAFGLNRGSVHSKTLLFSVPFNEVIKQHSRLILVSRDPYTRLYSAFIDKVYLGLLANIQHHIRGNNNSLHSCIFDITFDEFLQYVIKSARYSSVLNRHWAPIYSLCSPCNVNQYRLVKQETFSKDVEFIIKELDIDEDKYHVIADGLHSHRAEITITGIVETVYTINLRRANVYRCLLGQSGLAKRLWNAFKIQGFLDDRIDFPESKFAKGFNYAKPKSLSDVILETVKNHPLTSEESKQQRRQALVNAYSGVSQDSVEGIQDIYKLDFALFGYDENPPTIL